MSEKNFQPENSEVVPIADRMVPQPPPAHDASRMGVFQISAQIFQGRPDLVRLVFAQLEFIPHFAAPIEQPPVMEYMGHSPAFDALEQGETVPIYNIHVKELHDGFTVTAERQEEKRIVIPSASTRRP